MRDNIVIARFQGRQSCRTVPVWQYDYGLVMQFPDLDLPEAYEVHFASGSGEAVTMIGGPDGVDIPDALLTKALTLTTYIYLHTGEDDGETVYVATTPVTPRAAVSHEAPTPVQQDAITEAIAALNTAVDEAESIRDAIPETVNEALEAAKESGEFDGEDGVSPTVAVTEITGGHQVSVTDAEGTETFDVMDGTNGDPGRDGYSPTASVSKSGDTATITITDKNGTTTAQVEDGQPGQDGVSPTITVTDITGGHRVTITDATGAHSFDVMDGESGGAVQDVQVNGVSVLSDGVANVPAAMPNRYGVVKPTSTYGVTIMGDGSIGLVSASYDQVKSGIGYVAIFPNRQDQSTFFGLAKAAGDTTQSASSNVVGNYTEYAKSAISEMLSGSVSVSGTTPTITALPGIRYVCGEVTTLDITLPASGCIDVVFQSGSTATVLTITPPTGVTVRWANGFDPTSLDANTTYEINIADGCLWVAASWT